MRLQVPQWGILLSSWANVSFGRERRLCGVGEFLTCTFPLLLNFTFRHYSFHHMYKVAQKSLDSRGNVLNIERQVAFALSYIMHPQSSNWMLQLSWGKHNMIQQFEGMRPDLYLYMVLIWMIYNFTLLYHVQTIKLKIVCPVLGYVNSFFICKP